MKGSQTITKEEIRRIYALGAAAGLLESGNREDALHCVVQRITGKDSVSALTNSEFRAVQTELMEKLKLKNRTEPLDQRKRKQHVPAAGSRSYAKPGHAGRTALRDHPQTAPPRLYAGSAVPFPVPCGRMAIDRDPKRHRRHGGKGGGGEWRHLT